jgi:hypothetical protein
MMLTQESIVGILQELCSEAEKERRLQELNSYRIYEGELHKFVQEKLKMLYPKTWDCYNLADYNIHKKIVDKKSKSYIKPPLRQLENEKESTLYSDIVNEFNFNDAMKLIDRYKNQHKYCGLGVIRERQQLTEGGFKDRYNFWALAPYEFCVHRDQNGEIYAWSIPTGKDGDFDVWTIWTSESHIKLRTKNYLAFDIIPIPGNEEMKNPYGIIPFVYVPMDISGFYPYPSSLPRQSVELNANLSIYLTSGNMQIGQLVLRYPKNQPLEWVTQGLMTAIKLPQDTKEGAPKTEASYISPAPNLEGHKESILTFMMMILDEHGINSNQVVKGGDRFTSGFDRLIANADVQDVIEDNQEIYTRVENAVYKIVQYMNLKDGNFTFKSDKLKVKFSRPKILSSDSEKLDNLKKKKELGLWEEWELLLEADPNLTETEAKQIISEREARNPDSSQVFNGAQVTSLVEVVEKVASKLIPRESGVQILMASFGLKQEQAERIIPKGVTEYGDSERSDIQGNQAQDS